ncbi:His/Gly/Thr/Pro-type tRNA ligase C-terminal domain-containing protein [endosymbiont of Metamasius hemipterus]|uniref:His/Gly/Thr/Pro-type tRNA ligase C-terminal domain-containing protein n=1 Tax=endosymbiont of Metamasius hemipterus TaxID=204627 RepID=A0ABT0TWS7_9GAMM|nr:His/Gly/Thr/Pro-type tRNA ligase C-terminal domain-containing protein [endosymbiont of Metamasius hemipterus]
MNVFFNNDNKSFGQTIYNMDYIGVPYSLLINSKNLLKNFIEFKYRKNNLIKLINVNNILKFIKKILNK